MESSFSPKIEIIDHFDRLINRVDIDIEECLEKSREENTLGDLMSLKNSRKDFNNGYIFIYKFFYWDIDKLEENIGLWSESTKVVDYLNQVRTRTIKVLRKAQEDSLEYYKANSSRINYLLTNTNDIKEKRSRLFGEKFYFQLLHKQSQPKSWLFNLYTIVTDFYLSPSDIDLLENLINIEASNNDSFGKSNIDFDEKLVLISLIYERFFKNLTNKKYPSHLIYVRKEETSNFKGIKSNYRVNGLNLTCSSIDLSNLDQLSLKTYGREIEELKLEGLSSLRSLELNDVQYIGRITSSLDSLRHLSLELKTQIDSSIEEKLVRFFPNIEQLELSSSLSYFNLDNLIHIKHLELIGSLNRDFNFNIFKNLCNRLEKLSIKFFNQSEYSLAKVIIAHRFLKLTQLNIANTDVNRIERKLLDGFQMVTSLGIYSNFNLRTIDYDALASLKQLTRLNLNTNPNLLLDKKHFSELVNLEYLDLSWNRLKSIEEDMFSNLTNLKNLDLRSNSIESLNKRHFSALIKLENLNLSSNKLVTIPNNTFFNQINLKRLDLSDNKLENLKPLSFTGLSNLRDLNLRENNLRMFDIRNLENFDKLSKVIQSTNFSNEGNLKRSRQSEITSYFHK